MHTSAHDNHKCNFFKDKRRPEVNVSNHNTNKDLAHYLKSSFCKGSIEELNDKLEKITNGSYKDDIISRHRHPRYIPFDFECDTSTGTHVPNHVEVDILRIDDGQTHAYKECLEVRLAFTGYGCEANFCNWLFTKENSNSTVIAHDGAGYDFKYIQRNHTHLLRFVPKNSKVPESNTQGIRTK